MKNHLVILLITALVFCIKSGYCQNPTTATSTSVTTTTSVKKRLNDSDTLNTDTTIVKKSETVTQETKPGNTSSLICLPCEHSLTGWEIFLVIIPLIMFMGFSIYVIARLQAEGFRLGDALRENIVLDITNTEEQKEELESKKQILKDLLLKLYTELDATPEAEKANKQADINAKKAELQKLNELPDEKTTVRPQSTSRLLAFISGLTSIIIAISTVSYFFYVFLHRCIAPDLGQLWNVVLTLGIGIVPYSFNKLKEAVSSSAPSSPKK